ncbi:hypothetical protein V4762_07005 [Thermodesulfobium sp. 4217-1]|uniref:hypothetical protein n=1 Tax=Thermodesulfobium sp. 4217-1 TaxID=3120013 RepID=UPI0032219708
MNYKFAQIFINALEDYLILYSLLCPLDSSSFFTIEFAIAYIERGFPGLYIKELRTQWKHYANDIQFRDYLVQNSTFIKNLDSKEIDLDLIVKLRKFLQTAKKLVIIYVPDVTEKLFPYINLDERELLDPVKLKKSLKRGAF